MQRNILKIQRIVLLGNNTRIITMGLMLYLMQLGPHELFANLLLALEALMMNGWLQIWMRLGILVALDWWRHWTWDVCQSAEPAKAHRVICALQMFY